MEWAFHYSGPRDPAADPRCQTCRAALTKECPTHAKGFAEGCAHCDAAKGGPCRGHWGLEAALADHANNVEEEARSDYEAASVLVLAEPAHPKALGVSVDMRGSRIAGLREYAISVRPR